MNKLWSKLDPKVLYMLIALGAFIGAASATVNPCGWSMP